jgi:hypothetical protein
MLGAETQGARMAERLKAEDWEVRTVPLVTCRAFVFDLHYAGGGSNTAVGRHGLFRIGSDRCMGIAWWLPPTRVAAEASYDGDWRQVLALSRLVLDPEVPGNGASFLLARSRRLLDRSTWPCLITYADEWRGHTGAIYRADNWEYCGLTKPERVYTLHGRMIARKAGARSRTHAEMLALGAVCEGSFPKHKFRRLH